MQVTEMEVHVCIYTFAETGQIRIEYLLLVLVVPFRELVTSFSMN